MGFIHSRSLASSPASWPHPWPFGLHLLSLTPKLLLRSPAPQTPTSTHSPKLNCREEGVEGHTECSLSFLTEDGYCLRHSLAPRALLLRQLRGALWR